jgi:hypothetical protein
MNTHADRYTDSLTWFTKELQELRASPLVNLCIHSTRSSSLSSNLITSRSSISSLPDVEKSPIPTKEAILISLTSSKNSTDLDIEKHNPSPTATPSSNHFDIKGGRPDVASMIREMVDKSDSSDRIAVAACGPDGLMQITRRSVASCIGVEGPSLELFLEQFGW